MTTLPFPSLEIALQDVVLRLPWRYRNDAGLQDFRSMFRSNAILHINAYSFVLGTTAYEEKIS